MSNTKDKYHYGEVLEFKTDYSGKFFDIEYTVIPRGFLTRNLKDGKLRIFETIADAQKYADTGEINE